MSTAPQLPKHPKAGLYLQRNLFDGIAKFIDLEQRIADLPTRQERGDAFEVFVEAYLSTQPLHQAKTVWPFVAIPLAIKDRLALAQREVGVDGVFETHLGDYHAYQAKFRTDRPSLTWDELSTFMGLTDQIAERVVITNCDELSSVVSDRRGFYAIRGTDLDRLQAEDFEAIRNWLAGAIVEHTRKAPLPRQQDALDAIVKTFTEHDRATILMPCGTGKTLVALWAAEQLGSKKILVLVPSLALISQTLHAWLKETRWHNPSFLCVCSDPTVTSRAEDTLALHQADVDFPVTTEREAVRTFLDRRTDGVKVIFSTYQSARVVADGITENTRFDFGIFDEAHKTAGQEEAQFSFALRDANLPISKRLFMTATPRHYRVRKRNKEREAKLVYSMDVPEVYGPVAYRLSFAQAVQDKMICNYKVLISVVTTAMVTNELLKSGTVFIAGDEVKARQVANQLAIKDAITRCKIGKIITFHKSVADAASFSAEGAEGIGGHIPGLAAFHVNGAMASGKRDPIMRAFAEGDRTLISNARCLTEGVDVPAVDMVAFLSPKRSRIDIVQAAGRAMRNHEATQKTTGYVLLPLFLEEHDGERVEEAVVRSNFDEVWAVLQALQEHDEVLAEIITQMRDSRDFHGNFDDRTFSEKVEILAPTISLDILHQAITTRILDSLVSVGRSWESMFSALAKFKHHHGHCDVEFRHDLNLVLWIRSQREARGRGRLTDDQIRRLDGIGFVWEPRDVEWDAMFDALAQFKQSYGHCNVPLKWPDNPQLGRWSEYQRHSHRRGKMSEYHQRRLETLGFEWDSWEAMFATLLQFKQQYGDCQVAVKNSKSTILASWVFKQRLAQRRGQLNENLVRRLDEIGFIWIQAKHSEGRSTGIPPTVQTFTVKSRTVDYWEALLNDVVNVRPNVEWQAMFDTLVRFKGQYGHCNVPREFPESPELSRWTERQRLVYALGKLSQEQQQRLAAIGFEWSLKAKQKKDHHIEKHSALPTRAPVAPGIYIDEIYPGAHDMPAVTRELIRTSLEQISERVLAWLVYEENTPETRAEFIEILHRSLVMRWEKGQLKGRSVQEAFFIRCDDTTTTQTDIDSGFLIFEVGMAPVNPSEFVVFRMLIRFAPRP
jgi:superfamily II DNA or RNA helicase